MKRTLLGGLVLALALFVGQVGTSQAAEVSYDTFCDGASLSFDVFSGLASGAQTGCVAGPMLGTVSDIFTQGNGLTMGYDASAAFAGMVTVIRADRTWTHYGNTGGGITVVNSGTWSPGAPVAPAGTNGGGGPSSGR